LTQEYLVPGNPILRQESLVPRSPGTRINFGLE
jgi:hypothetical protein